MYILSIKNEKYRIYYNLLYNKLYKVNMFTIDKLDNNNFVYLLSNINGDIKYPQIDLFDIIYNNEMFNPFIDRLIDINKSINKCKFFKFTNCIDTYKNTKYNTYFKEWTNSIHQTIKSNEILSTNYIDRDDYLSIKILYDIYDIDYLTQNYKDVSLSYFKYLNIPINIIEIPVKAKDYIHFDLYINQPNENLSEYNNSIYIDKSYTDEIQINIINLNNRTTQLYKQY